MISLSDPLLNPQTLQLTLRAHAAAEALCELHAGLEGAPGVHDHAQLLTDILARLSVGSLCLRPQLALPHVRTSAVTGPVFAIGRSLDGIAFDPQNPDIRLIFLLAVPTTAVGEYLQIIAGLSRLLRDPSLVTVLQRVPDNEEFLRRWSRACESRTMSFVR